MKNNKLLSEEDVSSSVDKQDLGVLVNELQIAHLELEMQNDELFHSAQLLDIEREKFEKLFNLTPVGYFILDKFGVIQQANKVGAALLGDVNILKFPTRFQTFIVPEDWEKFYQFLRIMETSRIKQTQELKLQQKSGVFSYIRIDGSATDTGDSENYQYYIAVIDISESRAIQQNLLDTKQKLEMTLVASGTGTFSLEKENNKMEIDSSCYALFEINHWEFDGTVKSFISLIHREDRDRVRRELFYASNNPNNIDLEFRLPTKKSGIRTISIKGKEIKSANSQMYFAGILIDVTQQHKIAEKARTLQQNKERLILSTTFNAQEKERNRISSALHDSVCQLLYGIRLNIQNIELNAGLKNEFRNVNQLLDQAIAETRSLSYDLTPSILRDFGFTAGVKEIAEKFSTPSFRIYTSLKSDVDALAPGLQLFIFRIMQELINNCINHANATVAEIDIATDRSEVTLIVSDNGKGFDASLDKSIKKGSGLRGIKSRIFLLDGSIDIKSSKTGTTVTVVLKKMKNSQIIIESHLDMVNIC